MACMPVCDGLLALMYWGLQFACSSSPCRQHSANEQHLENCMKALLQLMIWADSIKAAVGVFTNNAVCSRTQALSGDGELYYSRGCC